MELKKYLNLFWHWAWLILLGLIVGAASGYVASIYQTPIYQAANRILIVRAPQTKTGDITYLSDQQLTQTYVQLLTTQPVMDSTSQRLGYTIDPDQVNFQIIRDTQIIKVIVEDNDPKKAADIANALVEVIIDQNEQIQAGRYTSMEESIQAQIDQIEEKISTTQTQIDDLSAKKITDIDSKITSFKAEIAQLQKDIAALTASAAADPKKIKEKQDRLALIQPMLASYQTMYTNLQSGKTSGTDDLQLSQLRTSLSSYQQLYSSLVNSLASTQLSRLQNTPNVVLIEPATIPESPVRPRPLVNTLLAGMVGLLLSSGVIFLIEYLDDTLKTSEEIEQSLKLSILGYIAEIPVIEKGKKEIYVSLQPRSPIAEAFRYLRTNLQYAGIDKPLKTLLVTSTEASEGKTTISANLAAILTQEGKKVILLDADLRRPQVHRFLRVSNRIGLSDYFKDHKQIKQVNHVIEDIKGLTVITSGSLPPNPAEILGSNRMDQILNELKEMADMIIIDTPPTVVTDAQVLAAKVDGVILVIKPGHTHREEAIATIEQFKRTGTRVVGLVVNFIPRNRGYYYGRYRYQTPHYYAEGEEFSTKSPSINKHEGRTGQPRTSSRSSSSRLIRLLNRITNKSNRQIASNHPSSENPAAPPASIDNDK